MSTSGLHLTARTSRPTAVSGRPIFHLRRGTTSRWARRLWRGGSQRELPLAKYLRFGAGARVPKSLDGGGR